MEKQPHTLIDLTGERFGNLTVIERDINNAKSGNARWVCKCDCGNMVTVIGSHLRSGHTKSCGCKKIGEISKGRSKERLYRIWTRMHKRCENKKDEHYKWYGANGVKVCEKWSDYDIFKEWALKHGYAQDLSIDRINVHGNYCPENCRWTTMKKQANNKTNNRIVSIDDQKYTVSELADKLHIQPYTIYNQLKLGWDIEKIVRNAGTKNE